MNTNELRDYLSGSKPIERPKYDDNPIPLYLVDKYLKENLIFCIPENLLSDIEIISALVLCVFSGDEEDVKVAALNKLYQSNPEGLDMVLIAATYDKNSEVRLAAIEALALKNSPYKKIIAERLSKDPDEEIEKTSNNILQDKTIQISMID